LKQLFCYHLCISHAAKIRDKVQGARLKAQDFSEQFNRSMSQQLETGFMNSQKNVRDFCLKLKRDIINSECIKQLIRSSGSVAANYIEASDDLGKLDEKMKIKISGGSQKKAFPG
jgi:hypothetical protein